MGPRSDLHSRKSVCWLRSLAASSDAKIGLHLPFYWEASARDALRRAARPCRGRMKTGRTFLRN